MSVPFLEASLLRTPPSLSLKLFVSIDLPPVRPNGLTGPCPRALIGGAQPYMVGGPPSLAAPLLSIGSRV